MSFMIQKILNNNKYNKIMANFYTALWNKQGFFVHLYLHYILVHDKREQTRIYERKYKAANLSLSKQLHDQKSNSNNYEKLKIM